LGQQTGLLPQVREVSPVAGLRRRRLGFLPVLAQSVSATAPTAVMATVPVLVLARAGPLALPVVAAAIAVVLLVVHCVTQFSRRMAAVGGLYSYVAKGLGPVPALITGLAAILGYAAVAMSSLLAVGVYLSAFAGRLGLSGAHRQWQVGVIVVAAGALAGTLMVRGIRVSSLVTLVVELVSVVLITVVLGALLVVAPAHLRISAVPATVDASSVALGGVLALAGFIGFESASTLGAEAARPLQAVSRAVRWTPAVTGVLFALAAVAEVGTLALEPPSAAYSSVPLIDLAELNRMGALVPLLDFGIAASFLACTIASMNALVRVVFCMSREGVLPPVLGRTHRRFHTPHYAVLAMTALVVLAPVLLLASGTAPNEALTTLLILSAYGYLGSYVAVCVAAPCFLYRIGEWSTRTLLAGGTATVVLLAAAWAAVDGTPWRLTAPVVASGLILVAGVLWILLLRLLAPGRLREIGLYDEATASDLLWLPGRGREGRRP
jgi:amino acid transporter